MTHIHCVALRRYNVFSTYGTRVQYPGMILYCIDVSYHHTTAATLNASSQTT